MHHKPPDEDTFLVMCKGYLYCGGFISIPMSQLKPYARCHTTFKSFADSFFCSRCEQRMDKSVPAPEHETF